MPDIFVPVDTSMYSPYYRDLVAKGIVNTYVIGKLERERAQLLKQYPDEDAFYAAFSIGPDDEQQLIELAAKEGLEFNAEHWERSAVIVRAMLKGLMARDLYDNGSYIRATNPYNPVFVEAVKLITDRPRYNKTLKD